MSQQKLDRPNIGKNIAVAIYTTLHKAETAISVMERPDFDMKTLSIVGKNYHAEEPVTSDNTTGDSLMAWGKFGAYWGVRAKPGSARTRHTARYNRLPIRVVARRWKGGPS